MAQTLAQNMICSCRVVTVAGSQIAVNVLWYLCTGTSGTSATDRDLATALDTALNAAYKGFMSANATYRGVGVSIVRPTRFVEQPIVANAGAGTVAADLLPRQVTGLITFNTPVAGRKFRGRIYPGFLPRTFTDANGEMNNTGATALAAIRTAIPQVVTLGAIPNVANMQHVIYHRTDHSTTPVNLYISKALTATQRRRGDEGRTNIVPF